MFNHFKGVRIDPESFCYFFDNLDRTVGALTVRHNRS